MTLWISNIRIIDIYDIKTYMKTSVELNSEKVSLAKSLTGGKTLKEVLDQALDCLIAQGRRKNLASIIGTDFFEGDLDNLRERGKNARR